MYKKLFVYFVPNIRRRALREKLSVFKSTEHGRGNFPKTPSRKTWSVAALQPPGKASTDGIPVPDISCGRGIWPFSRQSFHVLRMMVAVASVERLDGGFGTAAMPVCTGHGRGRGRATMRSV